MPIEEILLLAKDAALSVDTDRYLQLEQEAKERSRSSQKGAQQLATMSLFENYIKISGPVRFLGYDDVQTSGKITALVVDGTFVEKMLPGQEGMVILDQTPFYAEMGGQVGDTGIIQNENCLFQVTDCTAPFKGVIAHVGKLDSGYLNVGMQLRASVDGPRRQKIANNHTATHLLHWALHHVLGEHVKQAGSVVDMERLRFDFSHHKALTAQEIEQIEDLVNCKIRENLPVQWYEISYEEAQQKPDIKQFFGEKYSQQVRVIDIEFSKELCGGTHTSATGTIGLFRISKESSIAAGVRRIEAVTGLEAEQLMRQSEEILHCCAALLKTQPQMLLERVEKLLEENKQMGQELKNAKKAQLEQLIVRLTHQVEQLNNIPVLIQKLSISPEELRACADELMGRMSSLALILASNDNQKCHVIVRISEDLVQKGISAQNIVKAMSPIIDGSGGGKANSAQAGGKMPIKLPEALAKARELIR